MNLMAGTATASLLFHVNMAIVQIEILFPEVRQGSSVLIQGDGLVVALKTDSIVFGCIGRIKFLREELSQYAPVGTAVWVVAGVAVALFERTMTELVGVNKCFHLFVTGEA